MPMLNKQLTPQLILLDRIPGYKSFVFKLLF